MAAKSGYHHRFFSTDRHAPPDPDALLELTESDIYNSPPRPNQLKPNPAKKLSSPIPFDRVRVHTEPKKSQFSSLPVNVPDWSKILKHEYREKRIDEFSDKDDGFTDDRIPPHEYLAKQLARARIASYSLHEGIGRTLKGRDLSRVRNAIWAKTGFQD